MPLIFKAPGPATPGFLRRQRQAMELLAMDTRAEGPAAIDRMIDMLLPYVVEPEDRDAARAALEDASQNEFDSMLAALAGRADPLSPTAS